MEKVQVRLEAQPKASRIKATKPDVVELERERPIVRAD